MHFSEAGALTFDKMRVLQKLDPSPDPPPLEIAGSFQMAKLHSFAVTGPYAVSEQVFDEYDRVKLANLDHVESLESVLTLATAWGRCNRA